MALKTPLPIRFADVFPQGAFLVGVEPINDYEKIKAGTADPQERDKETGERLWALRIIDPDEEARAGQAEVKVKVPAPVQPVPPTEPIPGTPFRPVELEGLVVVPWVDSSKLTPRVAYSLRCVRMKAPAAGVTPVGKVERSAA